MAYYIMTSSRWHLLHDSLPEADPKYGVSRAWYDHSLSGD